jgi:hypothetical protein
MKLGETRARRSHEGFSQFWSEILFELVRKQTSRLARHLVVANQAPILAILKVRSTVHCLYPGIVIRYPQERSNIEGVLTLILRQEAKFL